MKADYADLQVDLQTNVVRVDQFLHCNKVLEDGDNGVYMIRHPQYLSDSGIEVP